jgi:hypothetical protein
LNLVVLKLVFDDLREDGLRDDFRTVLDEDVRNKLIATSIGRELLRGIEGRRNTDGERNGDALHGFVQKYLEDWLSNLLSSTVQLWAERASLRSRVLADLFEARNWLFGITPSSVRRVIKPRYDRNMEALDEIITNVQQAKIPLLVYIAPLRQDVPPPYEKEAYQHWIGYIEKLAQMRGFTFVNLERAVPDPHWGSIRKDDVDFMHFQGRGHKLLADALWPHIIRLIPIEGR